MLLNTNMKDTYPQPLFQGERARMGENLAIHILIQQRLLFI